MAITASYVDHKTFTVNADNTALFPAGIRVKALCGATYKYGTVASSSYVPATTTVILTETSDDLLATLISVEVGVAAPGALGNIPIHAHDTSEGSGGLIGATAGDHSLLSNLDYASAGHTNFQPAGDYSTNSKVDTASGTLQSQIDNFVGMEIHGNEWHSETYATTLELTTMSGVIVDQIPVLTDYPNGITTISGAFDTIEVVFAGALENTDYTVLLALQNLVDLTPSTFTYLIVVKETTGFTIKLSGVTDTDNYVLNWSTGPLTSSDLGITRHSMLTELDYASAGHTGFASSTHNHGEYALTTDITTLENHVEDQIVLKADIIHNHDETYLKLTGGTISENLIIVGDLTVSGTQYVTHTEEINITSNYLVVNANEVGHGVTAGEAGLQIDRGLDPDYFFQFEENTDTFRVGVSGTTQAVATREDSPNNMYVPVWLSAEYSFSTASGIPLSSIMTSVSIDTAPSLGGNLSLDGYNINYGSIISVNGATRGSIMTVQVDDTNSVFGSILCQSTDFNYDLADSDAVATAPAVVIATQVGSGSKVVLLKGMICNTAWNWNAGKLYVSSTAGSMTQTKPSTTGQQIQVVGYALSADTIWFEPVTMVAEVA